MSPEYRQAAAKARQALYASPQPNRETLAALGRAALALAPDAEAERHWARILDALADGHRFAVKTFPAVISTTDPLDPELIAAVEEIFKEEQ